MVLDRTGALICIGDKIAMSNYDMYENITVKGFKVEPKGRDKYIMVVCNVPNGQSISTVTESADRIRVLESTKTTEKTEEYIRFLEEHLNNKLRLLSTFQ